MSQFPDLAGVIEPGDVFLKGRASYVAWARIAKYMNEKAPGWQFAIKESPQGGHMWTAPDGTAYIIGYFVGPEIGDRTPDFPYSAMNNRNEPINFDKCSSRVLTDTHRRGFCAAAAFFGSLGYELWAKEEVLESQAESPEIELQQTNTVRQPSDVELAAEDLAVKFSGKVVIQPDEEPIPTRELNTLFDQIMALSKENKDAFDRLKADYCKTFDLPEGSGISEHIQLKKHLHWCQSFLASVPVKK